MAKYIDADLMALNESEAYMSAQTKIENPILLGLNSVVHRKLQQLIAETPAADAVEVLRCRDCKYWGDEDGKLQRSDGVLFARCKVHNYLIDGRHTGWCPTENDFCSYGERKDGAE